jgi:hypothetical protein
VYERALMSYMYLTSPLISAQRLRWGAEDRG